MKKQIPNMLLKIFMLTGWNTGMMMSDPRHSVFLAWNIGLTISLNRGITGLIISAMESISIFGILYVSLYFLMRISCLNLRSLILMVILLAKNNATTFCNNENLVFLVESEHKKLQDLDHWLAGGCIGRPQPKKYKRRDRTIAENARLLEGLTLSIRNFLRRSRLLFNIFEVRVF